MIPRHYIGYRGKLWQNYNN